MSSTSPTAISTTKITRLSTAKERQSSTTDSMVGSSDHRITLNFLSVETLIFFCRAAHIRTVTSSSRTVRATNWPHLRPKLTQTAVSSAMSTVVKPMCFTSVSTKLAIFIPSQSPTHRPILLRRTRLVIMSSRPEMPTICSIL